MKLLVLLAASLLGGMALCQSSAGHTFAVDSVEIAQKPLVTSSFMSVASNKIDQPISIFPSEFNSLEVIPTYMNSFLGTIHFAYAQHRPLVLSPDDIWLTICQGFGHHVAMNTEEFESRLLVDGHPDTIRVRNDSLVHESAEDWNDLIAGFDQAVLSYAKGEILTEINQNFSTTTPIVSAAYQVTVLDAVKSYFDFVGESGCGIPTITLLGTMDDWQKLYNDLDLFDAYGLEFWTAELRPVIKEFICAVKGKPNVEFWKSIYKEVTAYGSSTITGWVLKFFPYLEIDERQGEIDWENPNEILTKYELNPYIYGKQFLLSTISSSSIPKGFVEVPFIWENHFTEELVGTHEMHLNAGFFGMKQNGLALQPNIAWCISYDSKVNEKYIFPENPFYSDSLFHKQDQWVANWRSSIDQQVIFDPEIHSDSRESITAFEKQLRNAGFNSQGASSVKIWIAWDGTAIFEEVNGPLKSKSKELKNYINSMKQKWSPAQTSDHYIDVEGPLPINSYVYVQL